MVHGRKYWKKRGIIAGQTTERTEKFCAGWLEAHTNNKMLGFGGGAPDILSVRKKKKKFEFYEVKPYMLQLVERKHKGWTHASKDQRRLSEPQRKAFKKLIKNRISVYVIYYDRQTFSDGTEDLFVHIEWPKKVKGGWNVLSTTTGDTLRRYTGVDAREKALKACKENPRKVTASMLRKGKDKKYPEATDPWGYFIE